MLNIHYTQIIVLASLFTAKRKSLGSVLSLFTVQWIGSSAKEGEDISLEDFPSTLELPALLTLSSDHFITSFLIPPGYFFTIPWFLAPVPFAKYLFACLFESSLFYSLFQYTSIINFLPSLFFPSLSLVHFLFILFSYTNHY